MAAINTADTAPALDSHLGVSFTPFHTFQTQYTTKDLLNERSSQLPPSHCAGDSPLEFNLPDRSHVNA
ncbi:unnamed protein product [Lota lota]